MEVGRLGGSSFERTHKKTNSVFFQPLAVPMLVGSSFAQCGAAHFAALENLMSD